MDRHLRQAGSGTALAIAGLAGLNTVAALAGAAGLVWGFLDLGEPVTSRLPWGSSVVGGVALALLVAAPNALLTALAARRDVRTGPVCVVVGLVLVLWIGVQMMFIRELSFFHPLYTLIGLSMVWLGLRDVRLAIGISRRDLWVEMREVMEDLPFFVAGPVLRHWHLRWGATADEVREPMPGDDLLARVSYRATRAISIDAPPDRVWPWLVQVGCQRAGFYADDLLDNLGRPSATTVIASHQQLAQGDLVPMTASPTPDTAFQVAAYDAGRWLLWSKHDSTWSWRLTPTGTGGTRLVTRLQAVHDWSRPAAGVSSLLLLEVGDFAMMRRMLRGIKHRAEAWHATDESGK